MRAHLLERIKKEIDGESAEKQNRPTYSLRLRHVSLPFLFPLSSFSDFPSNLTN